MYHLFSNTLPEAWWGMHQQNSGELNSSHCESTKGWYSVGWRLINNFQLMVGWHLKNKQIKLTKNFLDFPSAYK